jgi:predicted kinase
MKKFLDKINEEMATHNPVVMAFGRMNPPTIGHEKLVNKVKEIAHDLHAPHHIILSHSSDAKKNPLSIQDKVKHAKRFFPNTNIEASSKEHPTFLQHAARLHQAGHDHLVMVGGSDRVEEFHKKLQQYNGTGPGKLYNFKKIEVKSAGHRDPDAEGAEGMSASKMREHAKNNDFNSFKQGVPSHVPERHAKELFRDVRGGMGINEQVNRGLFKAIFVAGGPGSGKDVIIREAIAEEKAVEINSILAAQILKDKHKLSENSKDFRREAIRTRSPLIINASASDTNIMEIKEELEELGYDTFMVFVNSTNESSQQRNKGHARMMLEAVRFDKWKDAQDKSIYFQENFGKYLEFDNSLDIEKADILELAERESDISIVLEMTNWFLDFRVQNETAQDWLLRHKKISVNDLFENLIREEDVKKDSRIISEKTRAVTKRGTKAESCPSCELQSIAGKPDDIKYDSTKRTGSYIFKTYTEQEAPVLKKTGSGSKDSKFSQDKEKLKAKKLGNFRVVDPREPRKVGSGIGPEYDTRGSGTVYPMSGFGNAAMESMDSPAVDMGVYGGLGGASNKEPLQTYGDKEKEGKKSFKKFTEKIKKGEH